ncbi:TlpA disulfide reductase family protein [Winogradskyella vidalii]|uniref:TlpA disulfide reductase family protein n=1 Tax=Winogradskyella vidalii TaxID=2615024 RepID=UPI001FE71294|nr:TlpA disulfide reductase family protein [Winogradskyella vidalii]
MKNLLLLLVTTFLFLGCKQTPERTDYIINGTAKDVYNGIRVHLISVNSNGQERNVDTQMVVNERFTFEGEVESPSFYKISLDNTAGKLPLMLENSEINIAIDKTNITNSKITGSQSQEDYENYHSGLQKIENEMTPIKADMRTAIRRANRIKQDSLSKVIKVIENKKIKYTTDFIEDNEDAFFSLYLIKKELNNPKLDVEKFVHAYNNLSSRVKTSKDGLGTRVKIESLYRVYQNNANLEIGQIAPNFEAPTPDGKMVALDDLKGKVTIIDFWAAWCGPCRRENPNVVRIYNKFHSQGLEIVGVSLDGSRTQKDPKQTWLDAIEADQLAWTHVSNLQHFNEPVAKLYNITAIPATYILDKKGRIAAKNLRGNALERKIEELLKN